MLNTPEFLEAWEKWKAYLKARKLKPSDHVLELHLAALEGYADPVAAILHSIESQYRKPYPPPERKNGIGIAKPKAAANYDNNGGFGN